MTLDAVIVGSGPGGSTAADVLTAAGWSVAIVEKGRNHLLDPDDPTRPASDYSNDEIKFHTRLLPRARTRWSSRGPSGPARTTATGSTWAR